MKIILKFPDDMEPKDALSYLLNVYCHEDRDITVARCKAIDQSFVALGFKDGTWVYSKPKRRKTGTRSFLVTRE